jgi:hypothetical protein
LRGVALISKCFQKVPNHGLEVRISDYPKLEADYKLGIETGLTDLHTINISSLPSGTYLLKAICRDGIVMTEKFVKR